MKKVLKVSFVLFMIFIVFVASDLNGYKEENSTALLLKGDTLNIRLAVDGAIYIKRGHPGGFHYDLFKQFAKHNGSCSVRLLPKDGDNYWEELVDGKIDILVIAADNEVIPDKYIDRVISSVYVNNQNHAWVVNRDNITLLQHLNYWLTFFKQSNDYMNLEKRYFNPYIHNLAATNTITSSLSPYDHIIKYYSEKIGWDWRLLASLIYQESKFSTSVSSHRGAHGLMQIRKPTAEEFGVHNLFDPEENIKAGTMYIKRLQRIFNKPEIDSVNQLKFILAAYNAGEGRIEDVRRMANHIDANPNNWESVKDVIYKMRNRENLPSNILKYGTFKGTETINYVDDVLNRYNLYHSFVKR